MADTVWGTKGGEASFGARKCIPGKNNDEWYLLEAMASSILVRASGEDDDERYK
jgi:hypothetical protein